MSTTKHVIRATVHVPDVTSMPTPLLEIVEFRFEMDIKIGAATISCSEADDAIQIVRKLFADELAKRSPSEVKP